MGPWKPQYTLALVVAGLLACSICWIMGDKHGHLSEKLSINAEQLKNSDENIKTVQHRADSVRHTSDTLVIYRERVREKVTVKRDTITVGDTSYVNSDIANLIVADDSTIKALQNSLALQDTLLASMHVGLSLRDERIALLEKQHSPRLGIKSGIAIGAVSTVAVVVVAVKVIQALHR